MVFLKDIESSIFKVYFLIQQSRNFPGYFWFVFLICFSFYFHFFIYFNHFLGSSWTSLQPSHLSTHLNIMFFLLKKKNTKIKEFFQRKQPNKTVGQKLNNKKYKKHHHGVHFVFANWTIAGPGACSGLWLMKPMTLSWGRQTSPSQKESIANCFLVRVGLRVHFPFPVQQFCLVCICVRLVHTLTVPEFTCLSALLCLEDSFS